MVGFGPTGPAGGFDPVRRVLTFTSAPLDSDLEICGPIKLVLYASSSARDTDFFIKLSDQFPQSPEDRAKGLNPFAELDHARLAARLAPRARSGAQHRHGALSQPLRSAAADAE